MSIKPLSIKRPTLPEHHVLKKDATLKELVKEVAEDEEALDNEYDRIGDYVEEHIHKVSSVARMEENKPHNRYTDIGEKTS